MSRGPTDQRTCALFFRSIRVRPGGAPQSLSLFVSPLSYPLPRRSLNSPAFRECDTGGRSVETHPPATSAYLLAIDGVVCEQIFEGVYRPVAGTRVQLRNPQTGQLLSAQDSGDGVFRIVPVIPGSYELEVQATPRFAAFVNLFLHRFFFDSKFRISYSSRPSF